MSELRKVTLSVIYTEREILLGLKKRGFGKGKLNGFGGKPEINESLRDCLIREIQEEAEIKVQKQNLDLCAVLDFYFTNKPQDWNQQVYVYKTSTYTGTPTETEEMAPSFFEKKNIPYERMWSDDIYWLPLILDDKKVRASFTFAEDGSVLKKDVSIVPSLVQYEL